MKLSNRTATRCDVAFRHSSIIAEGRLRGHAQLQDGAMLESWSLGEHTRMLELARSDELFLRTLTDEVTSEGIAGEMRSGSRI